MQWAGQQSHTLTRERVAYALKRKLGIEQGAEYLSMVVDGADQSKYDLPHARTATHATDAATRLKLHVMGVLVHGRDSYVYTCPDRYKQGHNVTIQAIWDTIVDVMKKEGRLPPVLLLQLDNTTKQWYHRSHTCFCLA
jgi:hypothetical protein